MPLPLAALALLKSRWTWYGLGAVAAVVLALGIRSHYINVGKEQGKQEVQQEVQKQIEDEHELAKKEKDVYLAEQDARIAEAQARATKAEADASVYAARAQALAGQLIVGRQQVAGVAQDQLHAFSLQQVREHPMPNESADPERAIAERVVAAPALLAQAKEFSGQIRELQNGQAALKDEVAALAAKDRKHEAYEQLMEGWYTALYNLHPPRKRAPKCLFLWRCADNKLPVPAPAQLREAKAAALQTIAGEVRP